MSIMGTRVVRTEDPLFLTRGATYTDDLVDDRLPGARPAPSVRSQVAHGRLLSVDASAAREAPGVVAVYTAEDLDLDPPPAGLPMVPQAMRRPWLATAAPPLAGPRPRALRRRPGRRGPHRGPLPGRGRRRARRRGRRPAAGGRHHGR